MGPTRGSNYLVSSSIVEGQSGESQGSDPFAPGACRIRTPWRSPPPSTTTTITTTTGSPVTREPISAEVRTGSVRHLPAWGARVKSSLTTVMIRSASHVGQMESLKKPRLKLRLALQLSFVLLCILASCGAAPIKKKKKTIFLILIMISLWPRPTRWRLLSLTCHPL